MRILIPILILTLSACTTTRAPVETPSRGTSREMPSEIEVPRKHYVRMVVPRSRVVVPPTGVVAYPGHMLPPPPGGAQVRLAGRPSSRMPALRAVAPLQYNDGRECTTTPQGST